MVAFKTSGTISIGNAVYLSADYTVSATSASTQTILGVAITAGVLAQPINVQCRGIMDAVIDASVTGGNYIVASNNTAGRVIASTGLSAGQLPTSYRFIALNSSTTQGTIIQIMSI